MELLATVLTAMWGEVSSMVTLITGSAILLIPVAFMVIMRTIRAGKSLMGIGGGGRRR